MNDITSRIKPYVNAIKSAANDGDTKALQIISLHRMHVACPSDPGAIGLCEAAFDDWLRQEDAA